MHYLLFLLYGYFLLLMVGIKVVCLGLGQARRQGGKVRKVFTGPRRLGGPTIMQKLKNVLQMADLKYV